MSDPLMLALDTSSRMASVALTRPEAFVAEYTWAAGQNHAKQLLPVIKAVLSENGASLQDLTALAVAIGPGSFNGLRVGLATAKGLALSLSLPLVGVSTLEVEAYGHAAAPWPVCAVHDAGRGQLAWAAYQNTGKLGWRELLAPRITDPEELLAAVDSRTLFTGELPQWFLPQLKAALGRRVVLPSLAASVRRGAWLAELAWQRCTAGEVADAATLQPLYLIRPPGEK